MRRAGFGFVTRGGSAWRPRIDAAVTVWAPIDTMDVWRGRAPDSGLGPGSCTLYARSSHGRPLRRNVGWAVIEIDGQSFSQCARRSRSSRSASWLCLRRARTRSFVVRQAELRASPGPHRANATVVPPVAGPTVGGRFISGNYLVATTTQF